MTNQLPANPDIAQLRRQAKELLRSAKAADDQTLTRLADAQRAIAQEYGFDSWPRLRVAVAEASIRAAGPQALEPRASRPVFADKERSPEALFTAKRFLDIATGAGWEPGPLPDAIIFTFHPVYATLLASDTRFVVNTRLAPGNSTMFETIASEPRIAVTCLSPGATAMIGQVEHQVALGGADQFMILGTAGSISKRVAPGSVVIVDSAVRDDGISQHYLAPDTFVEADGELVRRLTEAVNAASAVKPNGAVSLVAPTWTVPTPYRSTADEVGQLAADGVAVVECEVASLLAVAEALDTHAGALLSVTSSLVGHDHPPAAELARPADLLEAALAALGN